MKKRKKEFCPAKHEDHAEFYRVHPEHRTLYWVNYFKEKQ